MAKANDGARDGVLVVDKSRGPSSHGVVARARRVLRRREIGHAGTLDPMATGVLVIAIGEATKLVPYLTAEAKAYETTIALGVATDTLDAEGTETSRVPMGDALRDALASSRSDSVSPNIATALASELARTSQIPPAFSAIQIGGERAYAIARRGETPDLAARAVSVSKLAFVAATTDPPTLTLSLEVTKGYYVRSLARDLAEALGTVGHLTSLRRTRSGSFAIDEAISIESPRADLDAKILDVTTAATRVLPIARLTETGARDAGHGRAVRAEDIASTSSAPHAWLDPNGALIAIGATDENGVGRVVRGFAATG